MTTIIGMKCLDGIIIATDGLQRCTREWVDIKHLDTNKIEKISKEIITAGSGIVPHVDKITRQLKRALKNWDHSNPNLKPCLDDLEEIFETSMVTLHKKYNLERTKFLEEDIEKEDFFSPDLLVGGFCEFENKDENSFLLTLHSDGIIHFVSSYESIGSGSVLASYLLKRYYSPFITIQKAINLSIWIISEVSKIDTYTNDKIFISYIQNKGICDVPEEEIDERQKQIEQNMIEINNIISKLISKIDTKDDD